MEPEQLMTLDQISRGKEIVNILNEHGELSTAKVGDKVWGGTPAEKNWQKYARPAGKILGVLEKHGYVERREEYGDNYFRTFWKAVNDNDN